jgi:uncharacterized repeat protein (TIGR02543 family)
MKRRSSKAAPTCLVLGSLVIVAMSVCVGALFSSKAEATIEPSTTVTFFENDSVSDPVQSAQAGTYDVTADLKLFEDITPAFTNPGYTFTGWNTEANGSGTPYADGAPYSFEESTPLYAQWSPLLSWTITFNDNGGVGDVASLSDVSGTSVTLPSGTGLSFSGYTFAGWNTEANGSGTEYAAGQSLEAVSDEVLYAQWDALPSAILTFNDNGGVGSVGSVTDPSGISIDLPSGTGLSFSGYTFAGWNTEANGSGTEYAAGQSLEAVSSETLYAQWIQDPQIEISINANGGASSISILSGAVGSAVTLPSAMNVEDTGYALSSWNTAANGSGTSFEPGQTITLSSSMTLYAQWTLVTPPTSNPSGSSSSSTSTVTVNFVTDGGSGSLTTIDDTTGASVTLPSASSLVRVGYTLTSWNTEADGKGTSYAPGASIAPSTSLTLYAQWSRSSSSPQVLYGAIGDFADLSTTLNATLERQVRELAVELKAKQYKEVKLYGYTASTGLTSLDKVLSTQRASTVASYLRVELRSMKVTGVTVAASGEGSVAGKTSPLYSRVEVFVS